jgi:hypothetical protein
MSTLSAMHLPLSIYAKVIDNYCLSYEGNTEDFVLRMKMARTHLSSLYPDLHIFLCVKDKLLHVLDGEPNVFPSSAMREKSDEMAVIYDLNNETLNELTKLEKLRPKPQPAAYIISKTSIANRISPRRRNT